MEYTIVQERRALNRDSQERGCHVSSGAIRLDIGANVLVLLWSPSKGLGAALCIDDPRARYQRRARETLAEALNRLGARGIRAHDMECAVMGGSDAAPWRESLWSDPLREVGFAPERFDLHGHYFRRIAFDPKTGRVTIAREKADDAHWNPASAALTLEDGSRIFREGHTVANATRFFREQRTFSALEEVIIAEHLDQTPKMPLRLWCAACSNGAEVYSYTMFLLWQLAQRDRACPLRILGTDINEKLIEHARRGAYVIDKRDASAYRDYFEQFGRFEGNTYTFGSTVRRYVTYKPYDIRQRPRKHRFRVIICANVFQYYKDDARKHFLSNFVAALERPGYLFVGPVSNALVKDVGLIRLPRYGMLKLE